MSRNVFIMFLGLFFSLLFAACSTDQQSDTKEPPMPEIEAYSMPWSMPMVTHAPFKLYDNHLISVVFKSEMKVLHKLVPPPLVPNQNGLMFFYVGNLNSESQVDNPFSYYEAAIGVPVTFKGNPGNYMVVLYVDKALAITSGREIWGFPKKDAEIVYLEKKDKIFAQVNRFGTVITELSASIGDEVQPSPEETQAPYIGFKIIPSVVKEALPDVMQLTSLVGKQEPISLRLASEVSLKFSSTTEDPLGEIPVLDVVYARFTVMNTILDYGEVLYDYLKSKAIP